MEFLNWVPIVAILLISTAPLYAQRQQQNVAKLKADARNLVGIIGSDKTKTQTYCQIDDLTDQLDQAVHQRLIAGELDERALAGRDLVDAVHKDHALVSELFDDEAIMDNLVVAVHRGFKDTDHPGQRLDCHLNTCTKATWLCEQYSVDFHDP